MSDRKAVIQTGFFVLVGIGLFAVSIILFGGDKAFFTSYDNFKIRFSSTQGLAKGSVVSLSGMQVGNVADISFADDGTLVAELDIDQKFSPRLTDQSVASIRTQGALGDKYIFITPGPTTGTRLKPGAFITADTQPDFLEVISGKANDLSSFADAIREMNQLLHNLNANGKSALLMENLVNASQNISKVMGDPSIRGSFSHLKSILDKIDKGEGTMGALVNDATLHERLIGILGDTPRNKYLKPLIREAIKQNEKQR